MGQRQQATRSTEGDYSQGEGAVEEVMAEGTPCTGEGVCHLQRRKGMSGAKHMQRPSNVSACWVRGNSEWYIEPRL